MNSRDKGKRGERQWRDELRANGYAARRGQQFSGSAESPDVVCDELAGIHFEVKAVERLNIEDAMDQARRDSVAPSGQCKAPVVAHRRKHRRWLVTMEADFFFELLREFRPVAAPRATKEGRSAASSTPAGNTSSGLRQDPHPACSHPLPSDGRGASPQSGESDARQVAPDESGDGPSRTGGASRTGDDLT